MTAFIRRLASRVRQRRLERELAEELRFHLELRERALVESGMDPREAAYEARRRFGNLRRINEESREMWTWTWLESLFQDVRFGVRQIAARPGFAAVVVLTIALGAALNGTVFLLINEVLLRPPDVANPSSVVRLDDGRPFGGVTYPDYVDYRDALAPEVELAAFSTSHATAMLPGADARRQEVRVVTASGNYFHVLQVSAAVGRTFGSEDDRPPRGASVAVIGDAYWASRFNRDPAAIGRTIHLNRQPFTIVGVLPRGFVGPSTAGGPPYAPEMWVPLWCLGVLEPGDTRLVGRTTWWGMQSLGRLAPGGSVEQARARLRTVAAALDRQHPGDRHARAPVIARVTDLDLRPLFSREGTEFGVLGLAATFVLFIACANVASLLLARTSARGREVAIRLSLGAGRARILRQFLTESLLLSAAGTLLGLAAGRWFLVAWFTSSDTRPLMWSLSPDSRVLIFAVLLAIAVAAVTGLVPAIQASRGRLVPGLKDGPSGASVSRARGIFVGAEVAVCLVLLVLTALLVRGAGNAGAVDPGMPVGELLAVHLDSRYHGYEGDRLATLTAGIRRELETVPGVRATSLAAPLPFSSSRSGTRVRTAAAQDVPGLRVTTAAVSPSFFDAAGIPLLRGRAFDANAPHEVVVNEILARQLWPTADAIGADITIGDYQRERRTVVGIVRATPFTSLRQGAEPFMYGTAVSGPILVRTRGPASNAIRGVEQAVRRVDDRLEPSIAVLADGIADEIEGARHATTAAGLVGGLALILSLVGIGAVTSHIVVQRTHEVGVRMALGARGGDAVALLMRRSLRPVAVGMAVGIVATALGSRAIASQLYGVSALDPAAFIGAAAAFLTVAAGAAYLPARRASRIDPIVALRCE